jgi:hypothetical protein
VGVERGLIGPGLEGEEAAGSLLVFERRVMLAAGLLARAGDELDQQVAQVVCLVGFRDQFGDDVEIAVGSLGACDGRELD